jgi:hypothetical protein
MKTNCTNKLSIPFRYSAVTIFILCILQLFANLPELRAQSKTEKIDITGLYLRGIEKIDGRISGNRSGITSYFTLGSGYDSGYDEILISSDLGFYFNRKKNPFSKVKAGFAFPFSVETGYGSLDLGFNFQLAILLSKTTIFELRAGPMMYNYEGSLVINGQLRFKFSPEKRTGLFLSMTRIYVDDPFDDYEDKILRFNLGLFF